MQKHNITPIIDPMTYYSISDIMTLGFIPNLPITHYARLKMYNLCRKKVDWKMTCFEETTKKTIKAIQYSRLLSERPLMKVQWAEIIKFLKLNDMLN
jgi:hypothetical protein